MKKTVSLIIALFIFASFAPAHAEIKTFIKEYTYQASEADSKLTCRVIALEQVKRLLLEELGTYLESHTEIVNFQLKKDQITALTAGIVQTKIREEKWDGEKYWLKAGIDADPDDVARKLNSQKQEYLKAKELEELREKLVQYQKDNENLRNELQSVKGKAKSLAISQYKENIKSISAIDKIQEGYVYLDKWELENALLCFTEAINLSPKSEQGYFGRGLTYFNMGRFSDAIKDSEKLIQMTPKKAGGYFLKSYSYQLMQKFELALTYIDKVIAIEPRESAFYANRGFLLGKLGKKKLAHKDFQRALDIGTNLSYIHTMRGNYHLDEKIYQSALSDFQEAVRLDHNNFVAFFGLGNAWNFLGYYEKAIEYYHYCPE